MKLIFLDIDGVLNDIDSKSRCGIFKGIDDDKVQRLKQIVDATDARIVLTSTWKTHWDKNKDLIEDMGNYLNRKFKKQGLRVIDKTTDDGIHRGAGIINYINNFHTEVESWIVIDDEYFCDYKELDIISHMIKTVFFDCYNTNGSGGLQDLHVKLAIELLNKEE